MNPSVTPTPLPIPPVPTPKEQWKKKFPSIISGILAFLQFGITFVIVGCEIGSILIDMVTATIYVGLWAGIFFIIAWVSLAGSGISLMCILFLLDRSFLSLPFVLSLLLS